MKKNKTVLITGSSRGIGRAIALAFSKKDYNIILNCKENTDLMQSLIDEIKIYNQNVVGIQADISSYTSILDLFNKSCLLFSNIDILINNASISHVGLFQNMNFEEIELIINSNLKSTIYLSHLVLPHMISNKEGTIINISSIWGNLGACLEVLYSTTKGAINTFTKSLAKEVGPSGIKVNAIACGIIDTDMNSFLSDEEKYYLQEKISLSRFGTCEEIADVCLFLASKKASYINGQVLTVDGCYS